MNTKSHTITIPGISGSLSMGHDDCQDLVMTLLANGYSDVAVNGRKVVPTMNYGEITGYEFAEEK